MIRLLLVALASSSAAVDGRQDSEAADSLPPEAEVTADERTVSLLRDSRPVGLVRVEGVLWIERVPPLPDHAPWPGASLPIAKLSIEQLLIGPPGEGEWFCLAAHRKDGEVTPLPDGERRLMFLDVGVLEDKRWSEGTATRVRAFAGAHPLQRTRVARIWRVANSRSAPVLRGFPEGESESKRRRVPLMEALDSIRSASERYLPFLRVGSYSGRPSFVLVEPDGPTG